MLMFSFCVLYRNHTPAVSAISDRAIEMFGEQFIVVGFKDLVKGRKSSKRETLRKIRNEKQDIY